MKGRGTTAEAMDSETLWRKRSSWLSVVIMVFGENLEMVKFNSVTYHDS